MQVYFGLQCVGPLALEVKRSFSDACRWLFDLLFERASVLGLQIVQGAISGDMALDTIIYRPAKYVCVVCMSKKIYWYSSGCCITSCFLPYMIYSTEVCYFTLNFNTTYELKMDKIGAILFEFN